MRRRARRGAGQRQQGGAVPGMSTGMCCVSAPGSTLTSSVSMLKQHCRVLTLFSFSCLCSALTIMGTCRGQQRA